MNKDILVSILIRTCGKKGMLSKALCSIREQSYHNIEIIIIEDGEQTLENYLQKNFNDLNYVYQATGKRTGRTHAGNAALALASGKYLNFLDEDDVLLPDHVLVLMNALEHNNAHVAYSIAEEHQIKLISQEPYCFKVKRQLIRYKHPFNRLLLCYMNLFPIQSVMFEKELFCQYGGFDEKLDVLEDWDLWLRYAIHCDFLFVPEVTSIYHTPYRSRQKKVRQNTLNKAGDIVTSKYSQYFLTLSAEQINRDMDYILTVFNQKNIWFYMRKIRNYLMYRDI